MAKKATKKATTKKTEPEQKDETIEPDRNPLVGIKLEPVSTSTWRLTVKVHPLEEESVDFLRPSGINEEGFASIVGVHLGALGERIKTRGRNAKWERERKEAEAKAQWEAQR